MTAGNAPCIGGVQLERDNVIDLGYSQQVGSKSLQGDLFGSPVVLREPMPPVRSFRRKTAAALNSAPNTHHVRTRAAIAALEALAENAHALLIGTSPVAVSRDAAELDDGI